MASALKGLLLLVLIGGTAHARHLTAESALPSLLQLVEVTAKNNTIILTQSSSGYLAFAVNWITHAEALGITNWLTICEDDVAFNYLNSRWASSLCALLLILVTAETCLQRCQRCESMVSCFLESHRLSEHQQ